MIIPSKGAIGAGATTSWITGQELLGRGCASVFVCACVSVCVFVRTWTRVQSASELEVDKASGEEKMRVKRSRWVRDCQRICGV